MYSESRAPSFVPSSQSHRIAVLVSNAGSSINIIYVLVTVFIAILLYIPSLAHAPARRAICRILDKVGGMSLSVPPKSKPFSLMVFGRALVDFAGFG